MAEELADNIENMDPDGFEHDKSDDEYVDRELEKQRGKNIDRVNQTWVNEREGLRENLRASLDVLLQKTEAWAAIVSKRLNDLDKEMKKHGQAGMQPKLIENGELRSYQLEGVRWMETLFANGLNGILGDEMGLGKTLQTIAFLASLIEKGLNGPFLVVAPLSVVSNWRSEFAHFAPKIPVIVYHGDKTARADLLVESARNISPLGLVVLTSYEMIIRDAPILQEYPWKYIIIDEGHRIKNLHCRLVEQLKTLQSANRLLLTGTPLQNSLTELWSLLHFLEPNLFSDISYFQAWFDFDDLQAKKGQERVLNAELQHHLVTKLHTILRPFLLRRTKDKIELKIPPKREYLVYASLSPLQRSLYNSIIEKRLGAFLQETFQAYFVSIKSAVALSRKTQRGLDSFFLKQKTPSSTVAHEQKAKRKASSLPTGRDSSSGGSKRDERLKSAPSKPQTSASSKLSVSKTSSRQAKRRAAGRLLEKEESDLSDSGSDSELEAATEDWTVVQARKLAFKLKLQNTLMQMRKCVNHPYLFLDPEMVFQSLEPPFSSVDRSKLPWASANQLIQSSGKMLLLDQLLDRLLKDKHRVLIFSQMSQMIVLLEAYCELKSINYRTLVGSTSFEERQEAIADFNRASSDVDVFLLSTRAGGLGVNLASADSVILYDSDWNPQQDMQAQDRVHRIGQKRPVVVYRLVARDTAEARILERASGKRKLETLVIQKGDYVFTRNDSDHLVAGTDGDDDFKDLIAQLARQKGKTWLSRFPIAELQSILGATVYTDPNASLLDPATNTEGQLLTEKELSEICDRCDEAYEKHKLHPEQCVGASYQAVDMF